MDLIIDGLESRKNGDKYHDLVLTDAINHINKAQECLDEGMANPEKWWNDNTVLTKAWVSLFPFMYMMIQQQLSHTQDNHQSEENSPTEQCQDQGVEGIS